MQTAKRYEVLEKLRGGFDLRPSLERNSGGFVLAQLVREGDPDRFEVSKETWERLRDEDLIERRKDSPLAGTPGVERSAVVVEAWTITDKGRAALAEWLRATESRGC